MEQDETSGGAKTEDNGAVGGAFAVRRNVGKGRHAHSRISPKINKKYIDFVIDKICLF